MPREFGCIQLGNNNGLEERIMLVKGKKITELEETPLERGNGTKIKSKKGTRKKSKRIPKKKIKEQNNLRTEIMFQENKRPSVIDVGRYGETGYVGRERVIYKQAHLQEG